MPVVLRSVGERSGQSDRVDGGGLRKWSSSKDNDEREKGERVPVVVRTGRGRGYTRTTVNSK